MYENNNCIYYNRFSEKIQVEPMCTEKDCHNSCHIFRNDI